METEEIPWKAMDAACDRIRHLKNRFLLPYTDPQPKAARLAAGVGESSALARLLAERGGAVV